MKNIWYKTFAMILLSIIALSLSAQVKFAEKETVEQVSRAFIKSFQLENYDALYELFPPKAEVIALYDSMLPDGPEKEEILSNLENVFTSKMYNHYQREFKRILATGKKVDVDWRRLKLTSIEYEIKNNGAYSVANPTFLTCKHRNTVYTIQIHNVKLNNGWYVLPLIDNAARLGYWADPVDLKEFRANKKLERKQKREEKKLS